MRLKYVPVSISYDEDGADDEIGHERPIDDERIGRFAERLKAIIDGESVRSFAQRAGIKEGTLRNLLSGGLPRLNTLVAIADVAGVNISWLSTGEGPMMRAETEHAPQGCAAGCDETCKETFAMVPYYDIEASCGHGTWNKDASISSMLAFRRDWLKKEGLDPDHLAVITARGDSMEPTINSGDTLLIDLRITTPRQDGIYVIEQDGGLSAKRIQRAPDGTIYIRSDNHAYREFKLRPDDHINIIGRLAWIGRRAP